MFKFKPDKDMLAGEKHVFDRDVLDVIKAKLDGSGMSFSTVISKKVENPPLPYNLTVLLSDMSRRYGFSASKTQQITQDLRDKYKAITYNRSDSQYLKEEHFAQAPVVLAQAMENVGATWPLDYSIHSKAFNEKNVTAHHGIIPQEVSAPVADMTGDEAKVYTAIVERYAMQFLPPATYDVSTSAFAVDGGEFQAVARRVREAGFKAVFGNVSDEDGDDAASGNPWIDEGDHRLERIECAVTEKETAPPKPYTEGTLIADMASIAKYVTDPEVKAILKQKDDGKKGEHGGIGTTATRASIIEKLKERGYLEDVKGKIRSTEKARAFYHLLPPEIRGADVTARWWLIQQECFAAELVDALPHHDGEQEGERLVGIREDAEDRHLRVWVAEGVKLHLIVFEQAAHTGGGDGGEAHVAGDDDGLEGLARRDLEVLVVHQREVLIGRQTAAVGGAHAVGVALEVGRLPRPIRVSGRVARPEVAGEAGDSHRRRGSAALVRDVALALLDL